MATGMPAAQKQAEKSSKSRGGNRNVLPNFWWQDDKAGKGEHYQKVLRFLTDDVITANFYEFVPGGKPNSEGKQYSRDFIAPASIQGDREWQDGDTDVATGPLVYPELEGEEDFFLKNDIWLPDFKKNLRSPKDAQVEKVVALAVQREIVPTNINGRRRNVPQDMEIERTWTDKEGNEHTEKGMFYGLVRQGVKNFWNQLFGYFEEYGTICDRDYKITRIGERLDTVYQIVPLDPDPDLVEPEALAERYEPPMTLHDWAVTWAKYETADRWVNWDKYQGDGDGKDAGSAGKNGSSRNGSARRDEDDEDYERSAPVRTPASDAAEDLRKDLEQYKR